MSAFCAIELITRDVLHTTCFLFAYTEYYVDHFYAIEHSN